MLRRPILLALLACTPLAGAAAPAAPEIEMIEIPAGSFPMGSTAGNWDELPVHQVTISRPFRISKREISRLQFLQFRPDHGSSQSMKSLCVSWHDAVAFCEWLSRKEGRTYRLPTEAEWEHACRLEGLEGVGKLVGMVDHVAEWCLDWYGEYRPENQIDPVGPETGLARVLRGNKQDVSNRTIAPWSYGRPAYRAAMPPAYGLPYIKSDVSFRVVEAPMPGTQPHPAELKLFALGVKQTTAGDAVAHPPTPGRPYFRKRYLVPSPPETAEGNNYERPGPQRMIEALALHPGFGGHQHNAALEVLPNGDVLFVAYTCWTEYNPEVGLMAARLRLGADQWEMPSYAFDLVGVNDHGPLLWTDGERTHLFWGNPKLPSEAPRTPFHWTTTSDSGATWSDITYPLFTTPIPRTNHTPISTAMRDRDGIVYVASDGDGAESILWTSHDNMKTWKDMLGRTNGSHSSFTLLGDQKTIYAINGRKTHIDHYMTSSTSRDGARSFVTGKTPFTWGGSNQRASVLRLGSGLLVAAGDYRHPTDPSPREYDGRNGCFIAYSRDEGASWKLKDLPGAQRHETRDFMDTVGYSVLRQGRDGMIHLVTTMNRPCLHFTFNEAWLLSDQTIDARDEALMPNSARSVTGVSAREEKHPNGKLRVSWSAGVGDDGRYLLHGPERWFHPDGTLQYESTNHLGRKVGVEALYDFRGRKVWEWNHRADGVSEWTQYWPDGKRKARSTWRDFHADGVARRWDQDGKLVSEVTFQRGRPQ
jgi:hypothetical protein